MSTPDFEAALNKRADEIEKPKPLPTGTYLCIVLPEQDFQKIGQKETPALNIQFRPLQAGEDVDTGALSEIEGWNNRKIRHTLWLTEDSLWRVKEFLTDVCEISSKGKSLREMFAELPGKQVWVQLGHRPSKDGTEMYTEVKSVSKV